MFASILALAAAALAQPATLVERAAPDAGLAALQFADARLATVAWRLQTANVALCSDVATLPGFTVQALSQYLLAERTRVALALQLGEQPAIAAVAAGSASARAGLLPGDALVAVDAAETPLAEGQAKAYDQVGATEDQIDAALAAAPADLTVERATPDAKVRRQIRIAGDRGCASRVQLVPGAVLNASADGRYVQITGKMFDFAANDDELAVIVAHELAHNILHHRVRLDAAKVSRGLFAGFGRSGEAMRRTEYEADRLGVWLMARAGFDEGAAVPFWTRLGERTGLGILSDGTHPRWRGRIARVAAAVAEVRAQRAAGQPLVPPVEPLPEQTASQPRIRR